MSRKQLQMIFISVCLVVSSVILTSCAKTSEDVIRESIEREFNAYKNVEDKALDKIAKTVENEGLSKLGISGEDFASAVLEGFDYKIQKIAVGEQSATAIVQITSKSASDFEKKLSSEVQEFVQSDVAKELTTEEKNNRIGSIAMQAFKDTKVINEETQLQFYLEDKTWVSKNISEVLAKLDSLVFAS